MKEAELAFALLRGAIDGTVPALGDRPIETSTWWGVFKLMQRHHVVALSHSVAAKCGVPREVIMPWLAEREKATDWYRYQLDVQNDITDVMQKNGIPFSILKGTHLAQYYPQPELREFGDIDIFFGDRHPAADEVARRELHVAVDTKPHHHTKYIYRGVSVESHYDYFNRHYPASNLQYNKMLATVDDPATFDVLHFLRHAAIHFADKGLKLRDLCDWIFLVERCGKVDWNKVRTEVKRFGMSDFVNTLDSTTHLRLGKASLLWDDNPTGMESRFEEDILLGGRAAKGYGENGWKRRLAFGDSAASLLIHKAISHLSH